MCSTVPFLTSRGVDLKERLKENEEQLKQLMPSDVFAKVMHEIGSMENDELWEFFFRPVEGTK